MFQIYLAATAAVRPCSLQGAWRLALGRWDFVSCPPEAICLRLWCLLTDAGSSAPAIM